LVRDHPGRPVPEETTPLNFYGAGEDNGDRGTDIPGGRHPNRANGAPTPTTHPKFFLQARFPSCHPTNSVKALKAKLIVNFDRNAKHNKQVKIAFLLNLTKSCSNRFHSMTLL